MNVEFVKACIAVDTHKKAGLYVKVCTYTGNTTYPCI